MSEDKILFLVNHKNDYFYKYEDECIQPVKNGKLNTFIYLILKKLGLRLPKFIFDEKIVDSIGNGNKVIIVDSVYSDSLLKSLNRWKFDCKLYYMNKINSDNVKLLEKFDMDDLYTFSEWDSKKYGIHCLGTPYSSNIIKKTSDVSYDAVFLGREKNRKDEIERIYKLLCSMNLKCKFMVLDSTSEISKIKLDSYITYDKYIEYVSKSKCIVELLVDGQESRSLRVLESVFLSRKLITNCKNVVNEPFYNKNNIFILGVDNDDDIYSFINEPYQRISEDKYRQYDFKEWIRNFNKKEEKQ